MEAWRALAVFDIVGPVWAVIQRLVMFNVINLCVGQQGAVEGVMDA